MMVLSQTPCMNIDLSWWRRQKAAVKTPPDCLTETCNWWDEHYLWLHTCHGGTIRPARLLSCTYKDLNSNQGGRFLWRDQHEPCCWKLSTASHLQSGTWAPQNNNWFSTQPKDFISLKNHNFLWTLCALHYYGRQIPVEKKKKSISEMVKEMILFFPL